MTTQTIQLPEQSTNDERTHDLLARFRTVRAATLAFTAPLSPEDLMVQSCAEASPAKWHLAHTSWFFETFVLTPYAPAYQPFHPDFHWLFNSYYTSLGDMPEKKLRASFSRPPLDQILAFRTHVDHALEHLLESELVSQPDDAQAEILRRIALGLEHEQQHLELIATDIKHALFTNPLHPAYRPASGAPSFAASSQNGVPDERSLLDGVSRVGCSPLSAPTYVSFPGGLTEIGITPDPADPLAFAFDNETPRHTVFLQPFAIASRLVTAAEYLAFLNDNAYTRPELWLSEAWTTMRAEGWQAPLYWTRDSATATGWSVYTLQGFQPLDDLLDTPVCHLSFFEADAFARWAGKRLPTEFEWEHAAASNNAPCPIHPGIIGISGFNLLESNHLHPNPLRSSWSEAPGSAVALSTPPPSLSMQSETTAVTLPHPAHGSPLHQLFGDVWEWTASPYTGYPGYRPLPGALGEYNGKFMSSQIILRGGSCVTPATHIRATYRNFFSPATRWQFSGLRLAQDLPT